MAICGIDLGTTNSLIAILQDGRPKLVPNALGEVLTPSCVGVDEEGGIVVGAAARDRLITHPQSTTASFKRFMGSAHPSALGKQTFRPEELSAFVLKSLVRDAESHIGAPVRNAVISVPAYFNDHQRKATIDAGRLAGLTVDRLVNEPTAAALAYGLNDAREGKYLIFDLGGGTFDVSILDKYEGVMEIRATTGDTRLGGDDFTEVVETMIARKAEIQVKSLSPEERSRLLRAAEIVKRHLTAAQEAVFSLKLGSVAATGSISRLMLETECSGLLRRLRAPTERALNDSGLRPADFDAIVMVGGATRMPMVRSLVARLFGKLPLITVDPDTTVALGAAVQAGLAARDAALKDIVMTDVCPHTLGIAATDTSSGDRGEHVSPIIHRNAVVPISRTAEYTTVEDNQSVINVRVYQGENLRPESNVLLGSLSIQVPRAPKHQETVSVRFTYDINGALEVEVESKRQTERRVFRNEAGLSESELEARFKALEGLKLPPREQVANKTLMARAERIYAEQSPENRDQLRRAIRTFEVRIEDQSLRDAGESLRIEFARFLDGYELSPFDQID